jgi:hypothetical protein
LWLAVVVGILAAGTFGALLKRGDVDIRTALFYAWYGGVVVASFWRIFRYFEKRRLRQTNGYIGDNVVR